MATPENTKVVQVARVLALHLRRCSAPLLRQAAKLHLEVHTLLCQRALVLCRLRDIHIQLGQRASEGFFRSCRAHLGC
jgi:hypothetical protein